jgi:hypothetical protein
MVIQHILKFMKVSVGSPCRLGLYKNLYHTKITVIYNNNFYLTENTATIKQQKGDT